MFYQLPVIIKSGETILQVLQNNDDVNEHNYKTKLNNEAIKIITHKLNNKLLHKYKNIHIQYNILNKLFDFKTKLEILQNDIYKSSLYVKHFNNQYFEIYPLIFPHIEIDFIGNYIWDFIFKFDKSYDLNYLQTNIKDNINEKSLLDKLFNKLLTGVTSCDDIININDNNNNYEINFPYFEDNIYITLYNNDYNITLYNNDYNNNIVEFINNKIFLKFFTCFKCKFYSMTRIYGKNTLQMPNPFSY